MSKNTTHEKQKSESCNKEFGEFYIAIFEASVKLLKSLPPEKTAIVGECLIESMNEALNTIVDMKISYFPKSIENSED